ncbi:MAG: hypothetical protein QXV04_05565, partial [Desulfurococcaceae archaeon]
AEARPDLAGLIGRPGGQRLRRWHDVDEVHQREPKVQRRAELAPRLEDIVLIPLRGSKVEFL